MVKSKIKDIMEPTPDKKKVDPQILIVPMLGFTESCQRIGYGGGFYDRTIAQLKKHHKDKFLTVGVAFEAQKFGKNGIPPLN